MNNARRIIFLLLISFTSFISVAQTDSTNKSEQFEASMDELSSGIKKLNKFKLSGYIQGDLQVGEKDASLKVGGPRSEKEGTFVRFGIRRGRVKLTYTDNWGRVASNAVFQLDITEKGVSMKDAYFAFTDPWIKWFSIQLGVFDRPFGNEISYSSSLRESPERSTGCLTLFPGERDLGGMLVVHAPKDNVLAGLKLETGVFGGNGINLDNKNRKDWISHLSYKRSYDNILFGVGASYYLGWVYQGKDTTYEMKNKEFTIVDGAKKGDYSTRMYYGLDAQLLISTKLGMTNIRAEVIAGKQPGALGDSKSPNSATLPSIYTYRRDFTSFYVYFIQDFGNRHSLVLKYDRYDPNTRIANNEVGTGGSGKGDIMMQNFGFGYLFRLNSNIRLMAYYDMGFNETSENLKGYDKQLKLNTLTIRAQYKF